MYNTSLMFCFEDTVLKNKTFVKCCLNLRTTVQMLKLARLELTGLKIANRMLKALKNFKMNQALLRNLGAVEQKVGNSSLLLTSSR